MSVALFDLDKTLLDVNSGTLWLRHEWDRGRVGVRTVLWASWYMTRYHLGLGEGIESAYRDAVAILKGKEEAPLAQETFDWFEAVVRPHLRPGARDAIEAHRAAGERLVVATSSSPYAAKAAADAWGFDDFISTVFAVHEGRFTGDVASFAYGDAKALRVQEWADREGVDLAECAFYTDSVTDAALMALVGRPVAVNPDRKLAVLAKERGWPIVDWGMAG